MTNREMTHHFDPASVDHCKGSMANQVFGSVLINSYGLHVADTVGFQLKDIFKILEKM